jgi:hypothetical protein
MSGEISFVFAIIGIVLLIIGYIMLDKSEARTKKSEEPAEPTEPEGPKKRCMNCAAKQYEDMMDIRCRNKKSEHYGTMMDDYAVCNRWKGARE